VVAVAAVEVLLRMEVVAVDQALALVHALAGAVDRARALVPNAAQADRVWEITARQEAFITERRQT
jgi:hypothetical protein